MKFLKRALVFTALVGIVVYCYNVKLERDMQINSSLESLTAQLNEQSQQINELQRETYRPSYEYLKSITVEIVGKCNETNRAWGGTGIVVVNEEHYSYILTNAHVAGDDINEPDIYVKDDVGKLKGVVAAYHEEVDLALLRVNKKLLGKKVVRGFAQARPSDRVFLVGHHLGRTYTYGEGVFAGYSGRSDLIQIPTMFGNSGSAVVNQEGEVVSVIFALNSVGMTYVHTHGLAVNYFDIVDFLREYYIIK